MWRHPVNQLNNAEVHLTIVATVEWTQCVVLVDTLITLPTIGM